MGDIDFRYDAGEVELWGLPEETNGTLVILNLCPHGDLVVQSREKANRLLEIPLTTDLMGRVSVLSAIKKQ